MEKGEREVVVDDNMVGFRVGEKDLVSGVRANAGWGSLACLVGSPRSAAKAFNSRLTI
jgi:hypothetical protein